MAGPEEEAGEGFADGGGAHGLVDADRGIGWRQQFVEDFQVEQVGESVAMGFGLSADGGPAGVVDVVHAIAIAVFARTEAVTGGEQGAVGVGWSIA